MCYFELVEKAIVVSTTKLACPKWNRTAHGRPMEILPKRRRDRTSSRNSWYDLILGRQSDRSLYDPKISGRPFTSS